MARMGVECGHVGTNVGPGSPTQLSQAAEDEACKVTL